MHYYLVALTLLITCTSNTSLLSILDFLGYEDETLSREDLLDDLALEVCGIAFTAKIPSVIVNTFGPIAYCMFKSSNIGHLRDVNWLHPSIPMIKIRADISLINPGCRFLKSPSSRDELERQLVACKKSIGWPVERLIDGLKVYWARDRVYEC
jgi:hypothetical protein